jgi:hypothetical protein
LDYAKENDEASYWLLATGYWLLANNQKPEASGQKHLKPSNYRKDNNGDVAGTRI